MRPNAPSVHQRALFAEEALRAVILTYLAEHPGAMDTIDGIAEWWVTRQQIRVDVERLELVLNQLVRAHVLEAVEDRSGRKYRLRPTFDWSQGVGALPEYEADAS